MAQGTMVIVEDDFVIAMMLEDVCRELGFDVIGTAANAAQALPMILASRPTHLVLDYRLSGEETGLEVLEIVRPKLDLVKVIFVTGSNEPATIEAIQSASPDGVLIKPVLERDLAEALQG